MVEHVLYQSEVLHQGRNDVMPGAIERRQADKHERQDASKIYRPTDEDDIDQDMGARDPIDLGPLRLGDKRLLVGGKLADRVERDLRDIGLRLLDAEEHQENVAQNGWSRRHHLWIAANDDRVGMMPRVAPAPYGRLAQHHEAGDLIDHLIHPASLEGGAVPAFVPA